MSSPFFYRGDYMTIYLYQNTIPKSHIQRTFSNPLSLTGEPHTNDSLDVLNPIIKVNYNAAILQYNYCYIPALNNRYYFITNMQIEGKTIKISLHIDVLYTYKNIILSSQCIAERSSSMYDVMMTDAAVTESAGYRYYSRSLPYEFEPGSGSYILFVAGGT